jgi:hypothetical protein
MNIVMIASGLLICCCALAGGGLVALLVWDIRNHRRLGDQSSSLAADRLVGAREATQLAEAAARNLDELRQQAVSRPLYPGLVVRPRTAPPAPARVGGIRDLRSPARVSRRAL